MHAQHDGLDTACHFSARPSTVSAQAIRLQSQKGQGRFLGVVPCGGESSLWPKAIGFDVAFQEWLYEPRTVAGNLNPTVNGNYHVYIHLGTASLKLVF